MIARLRTFLTKRLIKQLKDEAEKDPEEYNKWYKNFSMFLKEGSMDPDYKKDIVELNSCLLYTSPSPRDQRGSRMPSSA